MIQMLRTVPAAPRAWPDYRAVWRWHFYAGLFCIPFVLWLSVTGSIYLWRPQVNAWLDRPYAHLVQPGQVRAKPSEEVAAALRSEPGSALHAYQLPVTADAAAQILIGKGSGETRVWVHPVTLQILKATPEDSRFMKVVFRLHGELLAGDRGSMLVELAASWAIVMLITGLYLWWPRGAQGLAGLVYPRLHLKGRAFWRDIHAVAGLWVSVFALFLLVSGLPWAKSWGGNLKLVRQVAGQSVVRQDWTTGRSSELAQRAALSAGSLAGQAVKRADAMAGMDHADMPGMRRVAPSSGGYGAIDTVAPVVAALALPQPVLINPAQTPGGSWSARSDTQNRPQRVNVILDPSSGKVLKREGFGQRDWVDQTVAVGVAAHEGQLFGFGNQLLSLFTAISLFTVAASGAVMWWKRRPEGVLGAPVPIGEPRFSFVLLGILIVLGLLLPLLGASMIAVLLIEFLILRRVRLTREWLGLRPQTTG